MPFRVERYHDISCGHRVCQQGSKCEHLHGHNYRVHFICEAEELDNVGRVIDFGDIKKRLCQWLEDHWDHRMLIWMKDPWAMQLRAIDGGGIYTVPFNPTAENMAWYLVTVIGPQQLEGTGIKLVECRIEETRKCSASYSADFVNLTDDIKDYIQIQIDQKAEE